MAAELENAGWRRWLLTDTPASPFQAQAGRAYQGWRQLAANPWASLTFGWLELARQVRVEGPVSVVDGAEADAYWASRPRGHQLGAWASDQSRPVADRAELDRRQAEVEARFGPEDGGDPVPRPPHWGGYRIGIERLELWQGQPNRLHDRFEYRADGAGGWTVRRLAP